MSKTMVYAAVLSLYPIGTRLRLENDYPGDSHEVYGDNHGWAKVLDDIGVG